MDATDIKILKLLQENSRISVSQLSKSVNMSLSAVSERLRKLETSEIISQYTTILNPLKLEKDLAVMMTISLENPENAKEFLEFIQSEKEITECHYITGAYDYMLKIITKNTSTLEHIMNKIKTIPNVKKTQTNVILSSPKNTYGIEL